jgi:alkylation response protein AidB-like acyl-CoA dehydrogenase
MNFELSEEQSLLARSVDRFVADHYGIEQRRALAATGPGFADSHWQQFAGLGWLALPFAEEDGGIGGSPVDVMVLMQAFGRGLVLEPYVGAIVLAGGVIRRAATRAQRQVLLPPLLDGSLRYALAHEEAQARHLRSDVRTTARRDDGGFVLDGRKCGVLGAAAAQRLIVSARSDGAADAPHGIGLYVVDATAPGLRIDGYTMTDGGRAADIALDGVRVDASACLGAGAGAGGGTAAGEAFAAIDAAIDDAILAISAEAVGAMEVLVADTTAYTQSREQFGQPLAQFQVVAHRLVDMLVEKELATSLLYRATMEVAQGLPGARRSVHGLKHLVGTAGTFVAQNAVQLHGGMGMTEELRIAHYFKRLTVIDLQFGDADHHLAAFGKAGATD